MPQLGLFPFVSLAFISPSINEQGTATHLLISEQQWAGGDRFAKTNNLISTSAALISSVQNSLKKKGKTHNIADTVIMSGLYLDFTLKGEGTLTAEDC